MNDPKSPASKTQPPRRARKPLPKTSSDAHGDFFYDELMTAQPDATQDYFRRRLMNHAAKEPGEEPK